MANGDHLEAAQVVLDLGGTDGSAHFPLHFGLAGGTKEIFKLALAPERRDGVAGGVSARQAVEAQAGTVDDRLPQGPQHNGAGKALEHLAGVSGVGKGDVLQHDEVGVEGIEVCVQIVDGQQHFLGHGAVCIQALEHGNGFFKLILCALQMKRTNTDGHISYLESHNQLLLLLLFTLLISGFVFDVLSQKMRDRARPRPRQWKEREIVVC